MTVTYWMIKRGARYLDWYGSAFDSPVDGHRFHTLSRARERARLLADAHVVRVTRRVGPGYSLCPLASDVAGAAVAFREARITREGFYAVVDGWTASCRDTTHATDKKGTNAP